MAADSSNGSDVTVAIGVLGELVLEVAGHEVSPGPLRQQICLAVLACHAKHAAVTVLFQPPVREVL